MPQSFFINGQLHSPYFIFVKDAGANSDEELLRLFGLSSYFPTPAPTDYQHYAILSNDSDWTLIADDWYYTLWHMQSTREGIAELAEKFEVFACSVGECDMSFDFVYYRNSQLVRRHSVQYQSLMDEKGIILSEGEPLPSEADAFKETDPLIAVMRIATSIGIDLNFEQRGIRLYAAREKPRPKLNPYLAPISNIFNWFSKPLRTKPV